MALPPAGIIQIEFQRVGSHDLPLSQKSTPSASLRYAITLTIAQNDYPVRYVMIKCEKLFNKGSTFMDLTKLPLGLLRWMKEHDWVALSAHQIIGGFAAVIYRIHVQVQDQDRHVIYKQVTKDRSGELSLIPDVMDLLSNQAPHVYGVVKEQDETGILMQYVGDTLKSTIKYFDANQRTTVVKQAALFLASLHTKQEHHVKSLIQAGVTPYYPVESALAWANKAITELSWAQQYGFSREITERSLKDCKIMLDTFYPQYPTFLQSHVTLTHGDPHFDNIVVTKNSFRLIDWEGACITAPQRDIAIFLQDVLDEQLFKTVYDVYRQSMEKEGWNVENKTFTRTFQAFLFDNTLMMLGWEIHKFREHYLDEFELRTIITTKLAWLYESFTQVFASSS